MYQLHATQFIQNERVFYLVTIPAGDLINLTAVDVWSDDDPESGYQRAPEVSRIREIAAYAADEDAIMPMGGLLNARAKEKEGKHYGTVLEFKPLNGSKGNVRQGTLTIPESALPLYIVDMQHRINGYRWAIEENNQEELKSFPLVCTIADGLTKMEEVDQFDIINTTQKKVRTDLARQLKALYLDDPDRRKQLDATNKLWEARGAVVARMLRQNPGVWFEKIQPPNTRKKDMPTAVMPETSFVTSLKPVLRMPYFSLISEEQIVQLIQSYWAAIIKIFPEAFADPNQYVIQKSNGVFSLHMIAPQVFELVRNQGHKMDTDGFYAVLNCLGEELDGSYFWQNDNPYGAARYGGMKGFSFLAAELRNILPKLEA